MLWFELDEDCTTSKCAFVAYLKYSVQLLFLLIYIWKNEFKYFTEKEYLDHRLTTARTVAYGSDKVNDSKLISYALIFIMVQWNWVELKVRI